MHDVMDTNKQTLVTSSKMDHHSVEHKPNHNDITSVQVINPGFLVGLVVANGGLDGEHLGSDEEEVLFMAWVVVNAQTAEHVCTHVKYVQPDNLGKLNWGLIEQREMNTEAIKTASPIKEVLAELDAIASTQLTKDGLSPSLAFVTDGPLALRQVLHTEAMKKDLNLPSYYWYYYDIRREFSKLGNNNEPCQSLNDIIKIMGNQSGETQPDAAKAIGAAISFIIRQSRDQRVACFAEPERIRRGLEHGICQREDAVDSNTVVRARGLPWQSSDHDVARFFSGLNIARGGVALCLSQFGRRNGEALVRLESAEHRDMALRRHRHFMGNRYIEVYRATGEDFISVAAGNSNEALQFLSRGAQVIVRMRGLPYDCKPEQILTFFRDGKESVEVLDGENGILFVNKADGRATGDAFVLLETEEDGKKAISKHKEVIGVRYIELFRSTTAEVQQVINKSMEPPKSDPGSSPATPGLLPGLPPSVLANGFPGGFPHPISPTTALLPQQMIISGCMKDCIRLRGLPYEAQVQDILQFLGDWAAHIALQGVHMVYNAQGHPSGEAFIQMDGEAAAMGAATERHNKYMQLGKKQRYIEVFQCSADDMNLVLTGPANIPTPMIPASPVSAMFPPGGPQSRSIMSPGTLYPSPSCLPMSTQMLLSNGGGYPASLQQQQLYTAQAQLASVLNTTAAPTSLAGYHNGYALANLANLQNSYAALQSMGLTAAAGVPSNPAAGFVPAGTPLTCFWPYPSPPISPSSYSAAQAAQLNALQAAGLTTGTGQIINGAPPPTGNAPPQFAAPAATIPGIILMRGIPETTSINDIKAFFSGYEVPHECIQLIRKADGRLTGDVFITFQCRNDAERIVLEKNRRPINGMPIDMYMYA